MDERTKGRTVDLHGHRAVRTSARAQAATAIDRTLGHGSYSNVVVRNATVLPTTDHAFFQRLVYTTLRHLPYIDSHINEVASRTVATMDPTVRSVLRIGVTEIAYLGTQDHAAVHEAVETVRVLGKAKASGFVNAVLRKVVESSPVPTGSVAESYPEPVQSMVVAALGPSEGDRFLQTSNEPAPVGIRFRDRNVASGARYAHADEDVVALEAAGTVDIIDPASAAVVAALDPKIGERIVDLAAAPGGKTRAIADAVGGNGRVVGVDIHQRRLSDASRRSATLPTISWLVGDAGAPPLAPGSFDRVLLDAPCTGLGTMRRRPEIRYRIEPDAPQRYGALQRRLLASAMTLVAPGGRIVYSVCTVTTPETTAVIDGLGFTPPTELEGVRHGDGLLLGPHCTGTDGMFIAVKEM